MKPHHHSVPAILISRPTRHARAWLAVLLAVGSSSLQAAPVAITGAGSYSQDFATLPASGSATWADDSTLPGWYSQRTGSGTTIEASAGTSTGGALYSYGTASTTERALGSLGSENPTAGSFAHGVQLQNTSGEATTLNSLAYTGEQWRKSGVTEAQVVTLWYKTSSSPITSLNPEASITGWTPISPGDFSSPVNTVGAGALDGNNPAHRTAISINPNIVVPAGNYLMIRWKDPDHVGADHGLAIDDVTLTWIASPLIPLSPGAIAFVGFNADGNDDLAFVALAPIAENEVIRFTDNEWNGSPVGAGGAFMDSNEGIITWTAPAGGVAPGTVVMLGSLATPTPAASVGAVSRSGSFNLGVEDETVYAYQEAALAPSGFLAVIATHSADLTTGTGLSPAHMIRLPDDEDVAAYNGSRSNQASFAAYHTLLGDTGNWQTEDADGDQSADGTAPDVPFAATTFTLAVTENTFASWLVANAPGESAGQDHDGDGVANGVEYFFGAAGYTFTPNPQPVDGVVSYPHPAATPGATYKVWISPDLSAWTDVTADVDLGTPGFVKYVLPTGTGKIFARLEVFVVP
jgi:hypothetical protein